VSPQRVEVIRNRPRDRGVFEGLVGILNILIETLTPLHITSPQMPLKVDEEHLRRVLERYGGINESSVEEVCFEEHYTPFLTSAGRPTIPGSSVKGNVRARLELSFRAVDGRVRSCFLMAGRLTRPPSRGRHGWRHHKLWGDVLMEERKPCNFLREGRVCLICDLFGAPGLKSLIDFSDFVGEEIELQPMELGMGVRILAAPRGSSFRGKITFRNLKPHELGLLLLGMGLKEGRVGGPRLLGRFKYRTHLGRVRYVVEALTLSRYSTPLRFPSIEVGAGEEIVRKEINPIVEALTREAMREYGEELTLIEEAEVVERIR